MKKIARRLWDVIALILTVIILFLMGYGIAWCGDVVLALSINTDGVTGTTPW